MFYSTIRESLLILIILIMGLGLGRKDHCGPLKRGLFEIQMAIDNSTNGDVIEVHSGTYPERLNVFKSLPGQLSQPLQNVPGSQKL